MHRVITNYSAPPVVYPSARGNIIQVRNRTKELIPVWSAAAIIDGEKFQTDSGQVIFNIRPAEVKDRFWGVVTGNLEPDQCGSMIVNGVTPAFIVSGAGRYATPGVDGISAGNSGRGEILFCPYDSDRPGVILLGGGGNALDYIGYFKLVHLEENVFEIINGYDEEDENCGRTDLPGCEKIPRFAFELPYNAATICLCVFHDENGYRTEFTVGEWNRGFAQQVIGNVYADGMVEQAYVAGGTIYFGRDWFL